MRCLLFLLAVSGCASRSQTVEPATDGAQADVQTDTSVPALDAGDEVVVILLPDPDADVPEVYVPEPWPGTLECDAADAGTDADPKTRFCSIYFDLFGPTSVAKCQTQYCHGGPVGINGLAMGWTGKACYDALTTHVVTWLPPHRVVDVMPDGGDSNATSVLPIVINPDNDSGLVMPQPRDDNRRLKPDERARISAWLARGAPFD